MTESTPAPKKPAATSGKASSGGAAKKPAASKKPATSAAPAEPIGSATPVTETPASASTPPPSPPILPAPPVAVPSGPQPMLERDARTWAMLVHILAVAAMLLSAGTLAFLAPLVIWLVFRERSALIDHHGKTNLNLQITSLIVMAAGVLVGFLLFFGVGFLLTGPIMLAYWLYNVIISIVAGVKANNGEYYRIPLVIRFFT